MLRETGYTNTTMTAIARSAGVSSANIYVYFESKLEILFALYDPWMRQHLTALEQRALEIKDPEQRLRAIFRGLWLELPALENGYANNLMQALSTASAQDNYSRELLTWAEEKVSNLLAPCLPEHRRFVIEDSRLTHVLFMAFDGFVMNHRFHGPSRRMDAIVDVMVSLLLDNAPPRKAHGCVPR